MIEPFAAVFHDPQPLLTAEAVGVRLGIKVSTLERWRMTGDGPPYVRISRKIVRYRRQDVQAFIDARVVPHTAAPLPNPAPARP